MSNGPPSGLSDHCCSKLTVWVHRKVPVPASTATSKHIIQRRDPLQERRPGCCGDTQHKVGDRCHHVDDARVAPKRTVLGETDGPGNKTELEFSTSPKRMIPCCIAQYSPCWPSITREEAPSSSRSYADRYERHQEPKEETRCPSSAYQPWALVALAQVQSTLCIPYT